MPPSPPSLASADVTDAELAVLERLWADSPATIRRLTDALYPGGGAAHYATVQKLLDRLEGKACVRRDASAAPHTFTPAVSRDELVARRLRAVADKLTGGSLTPLLTTLLAAERLSKADLARLRAMIDAADAAPARRKK
jgi:predicted transcriptional regulator